MNVFHDDSRIYSTLILVRRQESYFDLVTLDSYVADPIFSDLQMKYSISFVTHAPVFPQKPTQHPQSAAQQ